MKVHYSHRRTLLIIGLMVLVVAGVVMSILIWQRIVRAPQPNEQQTPRNVTTTPTSFQLPNSQTELPAAIPTAILASPTGVMALVNKSNTISTDYVPAPLVLPPVAYRTDKSQEEVMVRSELSEPLQKMFASAKASNIELMIGSAYRSAKLQETYFNSYVASSGLAEAEKYSAHPGTSEHQTGLAVDLTTTDRKCYLVECFANTEAGKWLAINAHKYGFILRYPKGADGLTGYQYEPWHFRYVGQPYASAIHESGLTYEEAYPLLKKYEAR